MNLEKSRCRSQVWRRLDRPDNSQCLVVMARRRELQGLRPCERGPEALQQPMHHGPPPLLPKSASKRVAHGFSRVVRGGSTVRGASHTRFSSHLARESVIVISPSERAPLRTLHTRCVHPLTPWIFPKQGKHFRRLTRCPLSCLTPCFFVFVQLLPYPQFKSRSLRRVIGGRTRQFASRRSAPAKSVDTVTQLKFPSI